MTKIKLLKKLSALIGIAALVNLVTTTTAQAAIIQVFNPSELTGSPFTVEDFEDNIFQPGASYAANSQLRRFSSNAASSGVTSSGRFGLGTQRFPDQITISFAQPASSVGLWFGNDDQCCSTGFTTFLDIFNANGLLDSINVEVNLNDFTDQFIGFNSNELVTQVRIRYGVDSDVELHPYIDDVHYNIAQVKPVPEPINILGLLMFGSLGLTFQRKNKNEF